MATDAYVAPRVRDAEVTTEFVRDELLRCFESANREFLEILGQPATEAQVREQVHGFVTAIEQCRANAEQMMGAPGADVIRHHYSEMMKLVRRLPE